MLRSIKKLLRIKILSTCHLIAFIGAASVGDINLKTVFIIFVLASWYLHAATSNDYFDRHIDKINLKGATDRPLINKDITESGLWRIHVIGGVSAVILSAFYGKLATIFTLLILFFDYAYSIKPLRISYRGILSQLILPLAYVMYPLTLGYLSVVTTKTYPITLALGLYAGFVARLFLKDFRDVKGDKLHGKMTFLLRHGSKQTCLFSGFFALMSLGLILSATDFALGLGLVLIGSQILGLLCLKTLSKTNKLDIQLRYVNHIARVANIAVIAVLVQFLCANRGGLSYTSAQLITSTIGITLLAINQFKFAKDKQISQPSLFQHFSWLWMRPFMVIFCRLQINGRENIKSITGNVIIASNHPNEFDPLFIVAALPFFSNILPIAYVSRSKEYYHQMPRGILYGGKFFEMMGAYPVYPGLKNYKKALRHHLNAIKNGWSVGIFPIGKIHSSNDISGARGGVSYLAHNTGLPVLPIRIDGVNDLTLLDLLLFKARLTITFGSPLYTSDIFSQIKNKNKVTHTDCEKAARVIMKKIAEL